MNRHDHPALAPGTRVAKIPRFGLRNRKTRRPLVERQRCPRRTPFCSPSPLASLAPWRLISNGGARTTCGGSRHSPLRCFCPHRTPVAAPGETAPTGGRRGNESPGSISQKRAQSALEPTSPISSPISRAASSALIVVRAAREAWSASSGCWAASSCSYRSRRRTVYVNSWIAPAGVTCR